MTTAKAHQHRQGKSLLERLHQAGIPASDCVRSHQSGEYVVNFYMADLNNRYAPGTDPARVWAQRILDAFPEFDVIGCQDTVAHWRPHQPILNATVFLRPRPSEPPTP